MPFVRPTLAQLRQQARAFFATRLPNADTTLRRSNITVSADTMAALTNGEYGYLDWLVLQVFPDTASDEYLRRWAGIFDLQGGSPTKAAGQVIFTGLNDFVVPDGTVVEDADDNQYTTQADGTVEAGVVFVSIEAVNGGAFGNLASGTELTLVSAIPGIEATATVADPGLTGGADIESNASLRKRLLARIRRPPQGGTASDYQEWAESVPGVTRAFVLPLNRGPGTVDVTFVMDGRADIIPLAADVAAVQTYIDARRPVTDDCIVFAPIKQPVNFVFGGIVPNTEDEEAAVTTALQLFFALVPTLDEGLTLQDQIYPAIALASGLTGFNLTSPNVDVPGAAGTILTLGTITFP